MRELQVRYNCTFVGTIQVPEGKSVEDYLYEMDLHKIDHDLADDGFRVEEVQEWDGERWEDIDWQDSKEEQEYRWNTTIW